MGRSESSRVYWGLSLPVVEFIEQFKNLSSTDEGAQRAWTWIQEFQVEDENGYHNGILNRIREEIWTLELDEGKKHNTPKEAYLKAWDEIEILLTEKIPRWREWTVLIKVEWVAGIDRWGYNRDEDGPNYVSKPASEITIPTSFPECPFTGKIVLIQNIHSG